MIWSLNVSSKIFGSNLSSTHINWGGDNEVHCGGCYGNDIAAGSLQNDKVARIMLNVSRYMIVIGAFNVSSIYIFPESVCEGFFVKNICRSTYHLHLHIFTCAHPHSDLYLCSCSHLHIYISAHLHILTSSLLIFTSTAHIISAHLHILTSTAHIFTSRSLNFLS